MRAPEFWYRSNGPWPKILTPAASLYAAGGALRRAVARPATATVPVVCVGNLVAGGAGKTPVAIALAVLVTEAGAGAAFLTRGYGGRLSGPVRVDPANHTAHDVGDEPLLLARTAPTWVARDRADGAAAAVKDGAEIIIMDDGFQNVGLRQDLRLLVVDGEVGFGNGRVIPAGPLREPIGRGMARADAVVLMEPDRQGIASLASCPVIRATLQPPRTANSLDGRRVLAFAGIGRPEKFFQMLRRLNAEIVDAVPFADHHVYSPSQIAELCERATEMDAVPITTEKDLVRLPPAQRSKVRVLPISVVWHEKDAIRRLLEPFLRRRG